MTGGPEELTTRRADTRSCQVFAERVVQQLADLEENDEEWRSYLEEAAATEVADGLALAR